MADIPRATVPEFTPGVTLLVKLGSIAVHADELLGPAGHLFDRSALEQLLQDAEVREWIGGMSKLAMLPVKRTTGDLRLSLARKGKRVKS